MPESHLRRALCALPILALTGPMLQAFSLTAPLGPFVDKFYNQSRYDVRDGVSVPVIKEFYGIPVLDDILAHITISFGSMLFYDDPRLYWQSIVFITDIAGFYAVLVLESFRGANQGTFFQTSFVLAFLAQFLAMGNVAPAYFYLLYVFSPIDRFATAKARLIDGAGAVSMLPMVILVYFVPHSLCYFHPSLEARNWWNWLWQLYPVWGSLVLFVLSKALAFVLDDGVEVVQKRNQTVLRFTVGLLAATSTAVYWYTLLYSGFSVSQLFIPKYFFEMPEEALAALLAVLQYDYILSFAAALLWLAYHFADLKSGGVCKASWVRIISTAAVVGVAGGPGTLLMFGWIAREEIMTSMQHEKAQ